MSPRPGRWVPTFQGNVTPRFDGAATSRVPKLCLSPMLDSSYSCSTPRFERLGLMTERTPIDFSHSSFTVPRIVKGDHRVRVLHETDRGMGVDGV
jgi:hypothetical protein